MTFTIANHKYSELRAYLKKNGYAFEDRPYQQFLAKKQGTSVNLYNNGKIVLGGMDRAEKARIEEYLATLDAAKVAGRSTKDPAIEISGTRIGTDEVGKGDYFGPLVIGGVCASEAQCAQLRVLGVRDSKKLDDRAIENMAATIRAVLPISQRNTIVLGPAKYNELHQKMKNVNHILGWGHATVIENLLGSNPECRAAVADQFGNKAYIERALKTKGKAIKLIQTHRAEREVSVAAASILARAEFLEQRRRMNLKYNMEFPKGATHVLKAAESFVKKYGRTELTNVAKVHFVTTQKIPT